MKLFLLLIFLLAGYQEITALSLPNPEINNEIETKPETIVETEPFSPEDLSVLDVCTGDLGNDGTTDIAVVVQYPVYEYTDQNRILYILTESEDGAFVCTHRNDNIILSKNSGGIFGDPYSGIAITDGNLVISDYGGSAFRWGNDYTFKKVGQDFVLSKIQELSMYTNTANGTLTTYDYENGTVKEEAISFYYEEEFEPLLIYTDSFEATTVFFEEASAWQQENLNLAHNYLPSLDYYDYFGEVENSIHNQDLYFLCGTEEALNQIQAQYYPDMKQVDFPLDAQLLENRSKLLGYDIPGYYYSDGTYVLYYQGLACDYQTNQWTHCILYSNPTDYSDYKYLYVPATSE